MKRRRTGGDTRAEYEAELQSLVDHYAAIMPAHPWAAELARVQAGEAVVVQGWHIDVQPMYQDFCLEADGAVSPVTAVYADPNAHPRTVIDYRRPDGSSVRAKRAVS